MKHILHGKTPDGFYGVVFIDDEGWAIPYIFETEPTTKLIVSCYPKAQEIINEKRKERMCNK